MENKRKILFITPLPPPVHGSSMVSEYIKESALLNETFDMDFVNLSTSRTMEEIGKNSLSLYLKKMFRFLASYGLAIWKLLFNHYDLCYIAITCHGVGFLKDMPFVLLCKLFGRKVVLHQHNKGMSECVDCSPYKWLMPLVYKNTKVILLSWRLYSDVEKIVKREQVLICPNGIPPITELVDCQKITTDIPRLLFLSNLITSKGVFTLLDACQILKNKNIDFMCDFIGGESKEISAEIFNKAVLERQLENNVHYLGRKYGKDKLMAFHNSDVFVLPTMNDCLPLTIIEAMQNSLPVVSTDTGAVCDLVEPFVNGLIVETNNANDLALKLEQLINDNNLRNILGLNGKRIYEERYSLKAFEKIFINCINEALVR